ncbi:MAG TPA: helical backbone metal receptor [Magnetospirillaceae bacterium]|nr:helical backbone metal receptor [Magnetospirillaceae bacterium]
MIRGNRAVAAAFLSVLTAAAWCGPVLVRDSLGREVALQSPARRVVSLNPSATESLFGIGAGEAVAGVTLFCNWPEEAARRTRVGGYTSESISLERILTLKPDLVVTGGPVHVSIRRSLESLGIPHYAFEPDSVERTLKAMSDLGALTGNMDGAARLAGTIRQELDGIASRISRVPAESRVRVFWEVYGEPLMTCGSASFLHKLIGLAGGVNIFSDIESAWAVISPEEVVRRAPQVILAADDHGPAFGAADMARRPGWASVPAVRNGRVHLLPADPVNRTGPRLAEGVFFIARALYPDLFQ